ncbi:uncharacterized, partial [Tachysurus ichikawai]
RKETRLRFEPATAETRDESFSSEPPILTDDIQPALTLYSLLTSPTEHSSGF